MLYMTVTYDDDNLAKHKVSHDEVDEVMDADLRVDVELLPSRRGNQRIMLIAFTLQGRLLEAGIEFFPERDHVFHADDASKQYKAEFERSIKQ